MPSDRQVVDRFHFCLQLAVDLRMKMEYAGDGFRIIRKDTGSEIYESDSLDSIYEYLSGYRDGLANVR